MPPISNFQTLMLPHQYADAMSAWDRYRRRHLEKFVQATKLRNLIGRRINEVQALAVATKVDRETHEALKRCAKEFRGLVKKTREWW